MVMRLYDVGLMVEMSAPCYRILRNVVSVLFWGVLWMLPEKARLQCLNS